MDWSTIQLTDDKRSTWAGMGNYVLISPDKQHSLELAYEGEPPQGDSFHTLKIDGYLFPGLTWGCIFAVSSCSRYFSFSWMQEKFERRTVVVDAKSRKFSVLPVYIYWPDINWPEISGDSSGEQSTHYCFTGVELWQSY